MRLSKLLIGPILGWVVASLVSPAPEQAQQRDAATVTGTVLDAGSTTPLPRTEVSWRSKRVTTDADGRYEIDVPAGIREVSFSAPNRPTVKKVLIVRDNGSRVRQDVLLPASAGTSRKVLALDRGTRLGQHGKDLASDVTADSSISLTDEYGNDDRLLNLNVGRIRVHSPVWLNAATIAFGKEGVLHDSEKSRLLGLFEYQLGPARIRPVATGIGAHFLSKAPHKEALAIANQKEIYVMPSMSEPASLRNIFSLGAHKGFVLSIAWAPDDRIYFTVDESIQLDDRHYLSRSRIASIRADGTDLKPDWAADPQYSYRYPSGGVGSEIIYCRFALDGKQQTLWSRNTRTGRTKPLAERALRAVYLDRSTSHLYYIYQQDLHLRDLKSGADWVIVNSVKEADYFASSPGEG